MRTVSCEKRYKNWYNWELWKGIPPTELHPFIILEDGRPCSSLCGRPRRESQEASCNFDKASKKDVTLRRRGDDENGNDSNPTKIMLEAGVCRHTPDSSMIFVGLLSLSFSSSPIKNRCFEIIGGNYSATIATRRRSCWWLVCAGTHQTHA